ncbi:MAG TPA: ATP-binding protein [Sulfuricurvum sp.]|nr:ATP-binding protein [Sulfuricurvum sp.]
MFEPYFTTKSENGTGLGLYMSKLIIEDHCKGTLSYYNTDIGVCFSITLPLNNEA